MRLADGRDPRHEVRSGRRSIPRSATVRQHRSKALQLQTGITIASAKEASTADGTRARILLSAQRAFSSRGYNDVGLREIAAGAGCDTTLIRRYFGPKERLFEQAVAASLDVTPLLNGPRDSFGERAVALFTARSSDEIQPVQMLIFATADVTSRAIVLRLLETEVIRPIAAWLGGSNGAFVAARITMICSGYFLYSRVLPLEHGPEMTGRWLAQQLQSLVDSAH